MPSIFFFERVVGDLADDEPAGLDVLGGGGGEPRAVGGVVDVDGDLAGGEAAGPAPAVKSLVGQPDAAGLEGRLKYEAA